MFERIIVYIAVVLMKGIALLPLKMVQGLGSGVGTLLFWANLKPAQITRINLTLCFPEKNKQELDALVKRSLQETAKTMLEFAVVWFREAKAVLALVRSVEGEELVENAVSQGRGILFLGPHHGNWEVAGLYLASRYRMASMYRPPKMKKLEQVITLARSRTGAELLPTTQRGVARLLSILKKGGTAGVLPDQVPSPNSAEFAPFFGQNAHTMTLVTKLAQRIRPKLIVVFALRLPEGQGYKLCFREAAEGVESDDLAVSLAAVNRSVENAVLEAVPQYQWEYKRFRRRLPGQKKLY
ncbi:MAG: lipid A biosynthesis acyltransferase [Gammaproteobacteria bacterium]|nr:MAG: lipid A biosynthesis acyltransferase [Gammaproteobacteria bacterium]